MKGYAVMISLDADAIDERGTLKEGFLNQVDKLTEKIDKNKIKYALVNYNIMGVIFNRLVDAKIFYNKAKKVFNINQDIQKLEIKNS